MQEYFLRAGLALLIMLPVGGVTAQVETPKRTPRLTTDEVTGRRSSSTVVVSEETETPRQPSTQRVLQPSTGSINWERNLRQALDTARSEDRLIVVDVYTDWCGWCKKMDSNIYSHPLIVGLSQQEVFLKLDAEDGDEGQEFARQMGVRGFPTTIVLNDKGRPVAAQTGYISSPRAFVDLVERARKAK